MLVRADKADAINDICDLKKHSVRLVTPRPPAPAGQPANSAGEAESFNNFSQDLSSIDQSGLSNPFEHKQFLKTYKNSNGVKWVASSRIMHRDIPYALCNNYADVAVIFSHLATYVKREAATLNCPLEIVPLPTTGNRFAVTQIGKVVGSFPANVQSAADLIYTAMTTAGGPWQAILNDHGMDYFP